MTRLAVFFAALEISCGGGEPGKPASAPATPTPSAASAAPVDKSVSQDTKNTGSDASPRLVVPPTSKSRNGAGLVPGPVDPPWLRLDLFPGATVKTTGRTAPDAAGLFSTQILYELAEGTTIDACVTTVKTAVADAVPALAREDGTDGRATLKGRNSNYALVAVCGLAKGKPTAYVSYEWLTAPAAVAVPAPAPAPAPAP